MSIAEEFMVFYDLVDTFISTLSNFICYASNGSDERRSVNLSFYWNNQKLQHKKKCNTIMYCNVDFILNQADRIKNKYITYIYSVVL